MLHLARSLALFACCASLASTRAYFEGSNIDLTFGAGGNARISTIGNHFHVHSMRVDPTGKLVVLYGTDLLSNGGPTLYIAARFKPDGSIDTSFGTQGKVDVTRLGGLPASAELRADVVFTDRAGRVLLAGHHMDHAARPAPQQELMLARLTPAGTPDTTFGTAGAAIRALPQPPGALACNGYVSVSGVAERPDGKLLVHGTRVILNDFGFIEVRCMFLAQFNGDGTRDESFGDHGIAETALSGKAHLQSGRLLGDGSFEAMGVGNLEPFGGGGGYATWKVDARGATISSTVVPWQSNPQGVFAQLPATFLQVRLEPPVVFLGTNRVTLEFRSADGSLNTAAGDQGQLRGEATGDSYSFAAITPDGGAVAKGMARGVGDGGVLYSRHSLCVWRSDGRLERCDAIGPWDNGIGSTTYLAPDGSLYVSNNRSVTMPDGTRAGHIGRFNVTAPIVEYYNVVLAHYYMTYDGIEARWIEGGGAGPGWTRTGQSFGSGGSAGACMFYGTPGIGPNSHFYTINEAECEWVKQDPGWTFVATSFYASPAIGGNCVPPLRPIHRLYNNRAAQRDSNHRYIRDLSLVGGMTSQGWTYEGVVFCARP